MSRELIAVIPARGGSKRLPNKNMKSFAGRPLVSWTLDFARSACLFDRILLTTDEPAVSALAGEKVTLCPRPIELAHDHATLMEVIWWLIDHLHLPDNAIMVLLMPTGPLRLNIDLRTCLERFAQTGGQNTIFTVGLNPQPPATLWLQDDRGMLKPLVERKNQKDTRKQNHPATYFFNDLILLDSVANFRDRERDLFGRSPLGVDSPDERSVPIDYPVQFDIAEYLFARMEKYHE